MFKRSLFLLLIILGLSSMRASAHPADMYAQDQSIALTSSGVQISWRILPGPFLADAAWAAADTNQDGAISDAEAQAWVAPFVSDLTVLLDSQPAASPRIEDIHWPASVDVLRTGEDAVTVTLSIEWSAGLTGRHALDVHNAHLEANSLNWFSLTASDGLTFGRPAQNNGRLTFDLSFPSAQLPSPSGGGAGGAGTTTSSLTTWTSGTPNLPDFTASLSKLAANLANTPLHVRPPANGAGAPISNQQSPVNNSGTSAATSALTSLVKNVQLSPYFLLSAFLLSLALGSLHALTPGHGKALVGAYLIGSRGRTRDAVLLGAIVTLTHTGSVLILGLVTLLASHYILPSLIVPWLELVSGVLVILFGLNLLFQRMRHRSQEHSHDHTHPHSQGTLSWRRGNLIAIPKSGEGHHSTDRYSIIGLWRKQEGLPAPESVSLRGAPQGRRGNLIAIPKSVKGHHSTDRYSIIGLWRKQEGLEAPDQSPKLPISQSSNVNLKSLLALGVSGGLVPCPDAIAILLVAVALNRVPFGMLLIVAFSLGLAAVLIAIGIVMVRGVSVIQRSTLISRSDWLTRFGVYAPVISAIVVTGLGGGLTYNAWRSFQFSSSISNVVASSPAGATRQSPSLPASSPSRLLYIASDSSSHDQLYMLPQPGGTPVQFTQDSNGVTGYSISPDGKTILYSVFALDGGSSIWSLQLDASGSVGSPQKVLDCPQAECNTPAWYPDGSKVVYERLENTTDSTTIPRFSVWWLDMQSGKTQPVFQDAAFPSTSPQFSPDGQWLSYISAASNTLVSFDLEDGRTLSVPLGSQAAIPESWSPDGSALLFGTASTPPSPNGGGAGGEGTLVPSPNGAEAISPLHVETYTLATGAITDLGGAGGATDFAAAWSPAGDWIAIDRNLPGSDPSVSSNQVWLVKPDGSQAHVLLNEAGASYSGLSWSPDGRLLLYSRYTLDYSAGGTGRFDVCSVDVATGAVTVLVPGGDIAHLLP